jgi:hypothetical protein
LDFHCGEKICCLSPVDPLRHFFVFHLKCAADAANYVHPKLASIQHGEDPDNSAQVTDADRLQVMLGVFRENPKLLDQLLKMLNSSKYETRYALSGSAN